MDTKKLLESYDEVIKSCKNIFIDFSGKEINYLEINQKLIPNKLFGN